MKLRNKKTGEIVETYEIIHNAQDKVVMRKAGEDFEAYPYEYNSLAELNEEWEDYEEPKEIWTITTFGEVQGGNPEEDIIPVDPRLIDKLKEIGNYFLSREEAEKAVEKLKAWKRLKDKGFKFCGHDDRDRGQLGDIVIYAEMPTFEYDDDSTRDDLDLLFSGEDD